jgi:hypothetical protein
MFRQGYNWEVHGMSRVLVIRAEGIVNKIISAVELTDIPSQWALGYVEMTGEASQSKPFSDKS